MASPNTLDTASARAALETGREIESLRHAADRAMLAGNPAAAVDHFERAVRLDTRRVDLWIGLAACRRALGEAPASLAAIDQALAADPRCFPALLMKGSLLEALGQEKAAAVTYGNVMKIAPSPEHMAEPTRRAFARAQEVYETYAAALAAALRAGLGDIADGSGSAARRVDTFIEVLAGRRKIYNQEPIGFHYPGLPAVEFFERDEFTWIEAVEARTDDIRRELLSVWAEGSAELQPYINYQDGLPLDQWAELNRSLNWSAYHLYLDGAVVETHARQCPATMEALSLVGQPSIPGRSPSAMFSILKPRTRIPPHTGVANTRMVVHLPLVVPEGCGFRVGGETRQWREGEAWVFDDTIEHEAWNDSDLPRAILIFDIWNPRLPAAERDMVVRLMAALDRFSGETVHDGL